MFRTLNPGKSYGKEFCSRRCNAEIKWHLNRHWLNPTSGMPQSRQHGDEGPKLAEDCLLMLRVRCLLPGDSGDDNLTLPRVLLNRDNAVLRSLAAPESPWLTRISYTPTLFAVDQKVGRASQDGIRREGILGQSIGGWAKYE
jgi:hypothetical protein